MTDPYITAAGIFGVVSALLWLGVLPYLQARKQAELNNQPIPSFAGVYLTSMIISSIGGFISVFIVINELEKALASATSILSSASLGFAFTYTILGISNNLIDLKLEKTKLTRQVQNQQQQPEVT